MQDLKITLLSIHLDVAGGRNKNLINHLHERALCLVHNDQTTTFEELLAKDKTVTTHVKNLQLLAIFSLKMFNNFLVKDQ